jgi:hypothetical protein
MVIKPMESQINQPLTFLSGLPLGPPLCKFGLENLRVPMNTGMNTHADGPSDGLGDLALVHGAKTGVLRVLNETHARHEVGHEGVVLMNSSKLVTQPLHHVRSTEPHLRFKKREEREEKR